MRLATALARVRSRAREPRVGCPADGLCPCLAAAGEEAGVVAVTRRLMGWPR